MTQLETINPKIWQASITKLRTLTTVNAKRLISLIFSIRQIHSNVQKTLIGKAYVSQAVIQSHDTQTREASTVKQILISYKHTRNYHIALKPQITQVFKRFEEQDNMGTPETLDTLDVFPIAFKYLLVVHSDLNIHCSATVKKQLDSSLEKNRSFYSVAHIQLTIYVLLIKI